jgi:hypothetical protein
MFEEEEEEVVFAESLAAAFSGIFLFNPLACSTTACTGLFTGTIGSPYKNESKKVLGYKKQKAKITTTSNKVIC